MIDYKFCLESDLDQLNEIACSQLDDTFLRSSIEACLVGRLIINQSGSFILNGNYSIYEWVREFEKAFLLSLIGSDGRIILNKTDCFYFTPLNERGILLEPTEGIGTLSKLSFEDCINLIGLSRRSLKDSLSPSGEIITREADLKQSIVLFELVEYLR